MPRTLDTIYDEWLVLRCQDGNTAALEELVRRWQPRLYRHAQRLTGDREGAADAIQDAWLAIVRGVHRLRDPAHFRPWAYRIVGNKCADWIRRRHHRHHLANGQLLEAPPDDREHGHDDIARLRAALRRLPSDRRALLAMHYLDRVSVAEIAAALQIPAGTVKSRLHHARNELRNVLERTTDERH